MIQVENIPTDLTNLRQWVAWEYRQRGGRTTKVPINPHTLEPASCDDPATWGFIEDAIAACKDGIGFQFTADDDFVGVDVDKCRMPDGTMTNEAWWAVKKLNSYAEVTPSGKGIHVICRGHLPPEGRRKGNVEIYERGRYFTVTGNILPGVPRTVEPRTAHLDLFHRHIFKTVQEESKPTRQPTIIRGDDEVLAKALAAKNGRKFQHLWDGDWERMGYGSQSEADRALCGILAYWCHDRNQIDRLFRQSKLYREKWDQKRGSETYGERTLRGIA